MSSRFFIALLVLVGALLGTSGCGGGGGSSAKSFTIIYATDWTLHEQAGGGQSQRITLTDSNRMQVGQVVLNYGGTAIQQYSFDAIPKGTISLNSELFSGQNLSGSKVGEITYSISLDRTTVVRTVVGKAATRLAVSPSSLTLTVPQSQAFTATAYNSDQIAFLAPGSLTWSTAGSIGSINSTTGVFQASQAGTGQIAASAGPLSQSVSVLVKSGSTGVAKWTILVYMNAANDLNSFSAMNVNQMETAATNSNVRIVLQWKQATDVSPDQTFNGTRRYLIKHDTSAGIKSPVVQDLGTGVDMGSPSTLNDFITWAKEFYPAERYALVIWNHGNGWRRSVDDLLRTRAFSYDDETGNAIQIWQLDEALNGHNFEIIAWDASLMQMLEIAYEAKGHATYVVGSEESPPGEGYPYGTIFGQFAANPSASSLTLAKAFVDGMVNNQAYANRKITQSVIDTSKLGSLASAASALSDTLIANASAISGVIPTVRSNTKMYSPRGNPPRYYLDLYDLCGQLNTNVGETAVKNAATSLQSAITQAVVYEGHNSLADGSHGVSIDFSPSSAFTSDAADYARMKFAADTSWDEYLKIAP